VSTFFQTSIEFLKGVGPQRAALLQKELRLHSFGDLIQYYPFRHEDRTRFYKVKEVAETIDEIAIGIQLKEPLPAFKLLVSVLKNGWWVRLKMKPEA
jgi:ATP-dependent DNA helicase RecG